MRRVNREGLGGRLAALVAALAVVLAVGWLANGMSSGLLSAIAIGGGVGVALLGRNDRPCAPRIFRRRG